jgi:hypothetical protein
LDVFIPNAALAFDYLGQQHYHTHEMRGTPKEKQEKYELKRTTCSDNGITLIQVPYWWSKDTKSIEDMIWKVRPDLQPIT